MTARRLIAALEPRRLLSTVADADLFGPAQTVNASSVDRSTAFSPAYLVDGTTRAFLFDNVTAPQRLAVSNFDAAIHTLRFFDNPSYTERAPFSVTIFYSPLRQLSLTPASYTPLGTFSLPTRNTGGTAQGDVYLTSTDPPDHPQPSDPFVNPSATISYDEISGLTIPPGTQSLLLDFGTNPAGFGFGFSEIQALGWETPARPADANLLAWGRNVYDKTVASLKVPGSNLFAETASTNGTRSGGSGGFAFVWPAATQFRALNALAQTNPRQYAPTLRAYSDELFNRYWRGGAGGYRSSVSTGSTVFYDDNGHVVVALAEAYQLTGDPVFLSRAVATYNFVLTGEDTAGGGGIYFSEADHSSKDAISTLQAARAGLMLYQLTGQSRYLTDATRLYRWAATHVQQSDGLFMQRYSLATGAADGVALINAAGIGIETNVLFYETTGDAAYLREAQRIARTSVPRYFNGTTGAINDEGQWAFELVDALGDLYLADHNSYWQATLKRALNWLHANREDPNGHYGTLWARDPYTPGTVRPSWHLIDQAAVARSYLHTAWLDTAAAYAVVVGRHVFYNNSFYDTPTAANPTFNDDTAIAADKSPLLPGEVATTANYTNYSRGINGVMVDVLGASEGFRASPAASDFTFEVASGATGWVAAPAPAAIAVRPVAGIGGGDRVVLTFPDGAILNTWLRVTVQANARTNLAQPEVFYYGNLVGDTFNSPSAFAVNAIDLSAVRSRQLSTAPADLARFDFNKDGRINATDLALCRANQLRQLPPTTLLLKDDNVLA